LDIPIRGTYLISEGLAVSTSLNLPNLSPINSLKSQIVRGKEFGTMIHFPSVFLAACSSNWEFRPLKCEWKVSQVILWFSSIMLDHYNKTSKTSNRRLFVPDGFEYTLQATEWTRAKTHYEFL
jgi:hypothetical protein